MFKEKQVTNETETVRGFLRELLNRKGDHAPFADDEPLATAGRLQSIDTLEVVIFLEDEYGLDFGEDGFDQGHVESLANIMALIEARRPAGARR